MTAYIVQGHSGGVPDGPSVYSFSMFDFGVLRDLGTAVWGPSGAITVARALRLPPLLGYLVAGLLSGPVTGLLAVTESLDWPTWAWPSSSSWWAWS